MVFILIKKKKKKKKKKRIRNIKIFYIKLKKSTMIHFQIKDKIK